MRRKVKITRWVWPDPNYLAQREVKLPPALSAILTGSNLGSMRAGHPNEDDAMRRNQSLKMLGKYAHVFLTP